MTYPTNPTNGQQTTVNGVVYTYNSTKGVWSVTTTFTGNVTVNQISANSVVSAGNVSAGGLSSSGTVSATSTITGGNLSTGGTVSATSTITGGNLSTGGTLSITGTSSFTGNITAGHINPGGNGTVDLGSTSARWRNIYTSDLNLNNGIGDYTIVEGKEDLFLYNNNNDKVYKFALIEVGPDHATPKIDKLNGKS
jgi:hypothetical protein